MINIGDVLYIQGYKFTISQILAHSIELSWTNGQGASCARLVPMKAVLELLYEATPCAA